jgi:hypothetical protein
VQCVTHTVGSAILCVFTLPVYDLLFTSPRRLQMAVETQDQGTPGERDDDEEVQVVRSRTRPSTATASTEEGATFISTSAAATGGTRLRKYGTARVNSAHADGMDTQQQGEDTAEMMDLDADSVSTAQRGRKQRGTDAEVAQVSTLVCV